MGVFKVKVDGVWVPISQGISVLGTVVPLTITAPWVAVANFPLELRTEHSRCWVTGRVQNTSGGALNQTSTICSIPTARRPSRIVTALAYLDDTTSGITKPMTLVIDPSALILRLGSGYPVPNNGVLIFDGATTWPF